MYKIFIKKLSQVPTNVFYFFDDMFVLTKQKLNCMGFFFILICITLYYKLLILFKFLLYYKML